jgi:hypothetical protein
MSADEAALKVHAPVRFPSEFTSGCRFLLLDHPRVREFSRAEFGRMVRLIWISMANVGDPCTRDASGGFTILGCGGRGQRLRARGILVGISVRFGHCSVAMDKLMPEFRNSIQLVPRVPVFQVVGQY